MWQSARKCTEVIQRKLKKSSFEQQQHSQQQQQQAQQQQLGAAVSAAGSISSPSTKPLSLKAANSPPPVPPHQHQVLAQMPSSTALFPNQSQVTRRGHRPLSAIVTSSTVNNNNKKFSAAHAAVKHAPVIDTLEDDSDNEQDAADRRLLRSKIIKSFWEQHDQEGGDLSEPEIFDKR